jgi:hypothetical protein
LAATGRRLRLFAPGRAICGGILRVVRVIETTGWIKKKKALAHRCGAVRSPADVLQATVGNGLSFGLLSFGQDRRAAPTVDVGGSEIVDAFVVSAVVVVVDESGNLRSFNAYDGPKILPSSTRLFCLIGADAGHFE